MFIYGLFDPRTQELRYIGKAANPNKRFRDHLHDEARNHRTNWIKSLKMLGLIPEMLILEEVSEEVAYKEEHWWISYMKGLGADLTNLTDGGAGFTGQHTEVNKERQSNFMRGNKFARGKDYGGSRNGFFGKHHTEEHKASMRGNKRALGIKESERIG